LREWPPALPFLLSLSLDSAHRSRILKYQTDIGYSLWNLVVIISVK
jgi:hypothetical protein